MKRGRETEIEGIWRKEWEGKPRTEEEEEGKGWRRAMIRIKNKKMEKRRKVVE